MSDTPRTGPRSAAWRKLEHILARFEDAWEQGKRPDLAQFLADAAVAEMEERTTLLVELVFAELEYQLQAGEQPRVEHYLTRFPELTGRPNQVMRLIARELELRKRREPALSREEYVARFPQFALELPTFETEPSKSQTPSKDLFKTVLGPANVATNRTTQTAESLSRLAGYEILGELGKGGMGIVYKARQIGLDRIVALKMLLRGPFAKELERDRFRREAAAVGKLQNPHIVQIYEIGERDGQPFFTMEFVAGGNLGEHIKGMPRPPRQAAEQAQVLARAMHGVHLQEIVHRDLKPSNVLVGGDGLLKISDFGLAKRLDAASENTPSGAVLGTPSYMAPEQASATKHIGPAADVYSLGAILYELLTGRPPFRAATDLETLHQVLTADPVQPKRLQPGLPGELETITLKCLDKDPERRYASALDLADDLRRFLNNEPIKARPASLVEKAWKWARRRPAAAALVAVASLLIVVLVAAGMSIAHVERERRIEGDKLRQQAEEQAREARKQTELAKLNLLVAEEQRQRAEDHFQKAHKTVQLLTLIGHQRLLAVPHLENIRRYFLEQALKSYESFVQEKNADPFARWQTSRALLRVAEIRNMLGQRAQAEKDYTRALEYLALLAKEFPDNSDYRRDLGMAHHDLGIVQQSLGKVDAAEKSYERALTLRDELAEDAAHLHAQADLASTHAQMGGMFHLQKKYPQAEKQYLRALAILEGLTDDPQANDWLPIRAKNSMNLGVLYLQTKRFKEAEKSLHQAQTIWEQALIRFPDFPDFQFDLAQTTLNLGNLRRDLQQFPEAEVEYQKSRELLTQLQQKFPRVLDYRYLFALTQKDLALLHRNRSQLDDEADAWKRAVILYDGLVKDAATLTFRQGYASSLHEWAIALVRSGQSTLGEKMFHDAADALAQLVKEFPSNQGLWDEWALCHENQANRFQAMQLAASAAQAAKHRQQSLAIQEKRLAQFPDVLRYHLEPGETLAAFAKQMVKSKDLPTAAEHYVQAAMRICKVPATATDKEKSSVEQRQALEKKVGDKAIVWLRAAIQTAGYRDAAFLEKAPDLQLLRGRADFQAMLQEAKKK